MPIRRGFAVLAVLVGLIGLAVSIGPSLTSAADSALPAEFVAVSPGPGVQEKMALYSSVTGALTRRLATFGESFTNNGLAVAPDGSAVYFTLIPRHAGRFGLRLMRLDVATRRQTFVAEGGAPAVSDDGTQLAYGASPHGLAVRDLASGSTRTLGLVTQLGPAANLLDASVTWLADGSDVAVVPSPPAYAAAAELRSASNASGSCHFSARRAVVVFVHVPPPPGRLSADCVHLPGPAPTAETIAADASSPTSLLLAKFGRRTDVERVAMTGTVARVLGLGGNLPLAIDRTGEHILYLVGHSPPALWEATIADKRLTDKRRLIANSKLGPAAW